MGRRCGWGNNVLTTEGTEDTGEDETPLTRRTPRITKGQKAGHDDTAPVLEPVDRVDSKDTIRTGLGAVEDAPFDILLRLLQRDHQTMGIGWELFCKRIPREWRALGRRASIKSHHIKTFQLFVRWQNNVGRKGRVRYVVTPLFSVKFPLICVRNKTTEFVRGKRTPHARVLG